MSSEFENYNRSAPGVLSQRSQVQEDHASQQEERLQIMYSKDQVYQEDAEFSLEELRAQRYYKYLNERAAHVKKLKQDLQRQIEEKRGRIQQRNSTADNQVVDEEAGSSFQKSAGSCESAAAVVKAAPFTACSKQEEHSVVSSRSSVRREDDINRSEGDTKPQKAARPFTVFDENTLTNKILSSVSRNSLKLPTLSLKAPKSKAELVSEKQEASISRSEEAIINGHWNKTLCRSPDNTSEFARAAQLASSPFAGVERTNASESGATENLSRTAPESTKAPSSTTTAEKELSPILEISQEWGGASFGTFSHNSLKHLKEPEIIRVEEMLEMPEEAITESKDVCGFSVRSRLFDQADKTSFSNFQQKSGCLPDTSDDLCLDGEMLICKRETLQDLTFYFTSTATVLRKVDRSRVPWDFFISSQLRSRRSGDEPDAEVQICCYAFEDGCMTLWRLPHGHTLQDLLSEPSSEQEVSLLVVLFLELVKDFHSCRVVHGGLKPETLYYYLRGITALDFSNSVDLQLQTEVTTAQDLPSAQKYIQQGLLSPSASPYQVDLIGVAEVVHMLLFNQCLKVKQENSSWSLDEGPGSRHSVPVKPLWKDFFHMILNPEQKSSELVLSELISNVTHEFKLRPFILK